MRLGSSHLLSLALYIFGASAHDHGKDREPLKQLNYDQVRLTGGPFAEQHRAVQAHYLSIDNDRILKAYRQSAGLPAPGDDMGGWYDLDGFVPGHALGQFISGLARIGSTTGDEACHEKVRILVKGFAETLGPRNSSILSPEDNLWVCYTLDKHFVGLIDAATLSGMEEAIPLLSRVLSGGLHLMPEKVHDRDGVHNKPYDEPFVMPENLFDAAELTGDPNFKDYAHRYLLNKEFFDILADGGDPLPGQHAYAHAIALSSGGKAYLATGDERYPKALEQAFKLINTQQRYASGGWGPDEAFVHPDSGELGDSLESTHNHFETPCGTYASTKFARYLMRLTPEPSNTDHGDYLERVLFNTVLAATPPDSDGDYFYYSNYSSRAEKVYYDSKWPCCSGTYLQTVADYPLSLGFGTDRGLYINFYTPSIIKHSVGGRDISVEQTTDFPATDEVTLTVDSKRPLPWTMMLRIPSWVSGHATVLINGRRHSSAKAGSWLNIKRVWRSGDTVTLTLPQSFRFEPIDDHHPNTGALMRGPVQYVAIDPPKGTLTLPSLHKLRESAPQIYTGPGGITFVPLYLTGNGIYSSYFAKS